MQAIQIPFILPQPKLNNKSAFGLLLIHTSNLNLLGNKVQDSIFVDKCPYLLLCKWFIVRNVRNIWVLTKKKCHSTNVVIYGDDA